MRAGHGLETTLQEVPLKCSMTVAPNANVSTAQTSLVASADTRRKQHPDRTFRGLPGRAIEVFEKRKQRLPIVGQDEARDPHVARGDCG